MKTAIRSKLATLILSGLITSSMYSQFKVEVNGSSIQPNQEFNYKDLQNVSVSFSNAKKIPEYTTGRVKLKVVGYSDKNEQLNVWYIEKNGYSALNDFLYPTKPVAYKMLTDGKSTSDFTYMISKDIKHTCKDLDGDVKTRKMRIEISLIFNEKVTYDSYGSDIVLVDNFSFMIDIWSKSTTVNIEGLNASFEFNDQLTYQSFDKKKDPGGQLESFGSPEIYNFYFKDYTLRMRLIKVGTSQETEINNLKTSFENYLTYISNLCNGDKILKALPASDGKEWKEVTGFMQGPAAYGNTDQWNTIYLPLDQKLNKDTYQNVKIFESISLGSLQGYRFKGIKSSVRCVSGGIFSGFSSKTDSEKITVAGNDVLYILKHPTNPQYVFLINSSSELQESNEDKLKIKAHIFDAFLSGLVFK